MKKLALILIVLLGFRAAQATEVITVEIGEVLDDTFFYKLPTLVGADSSSMLIPLKQKSEVVILYESLGQKGWVFAKLDRTQGWVLESLLIHRRKEKRYLLAKSKAKVNSLKLVIQKRQAPTVVPESDWADVELKKRLE